eukprot:9226255-Pyramimonas_sp.AAC.1
MSLMHRFPHPAVVLPPLPFWLAPPSAALLPPLGAAPSAAARASARRLSSSICASSSAICSSLAAIRSSTRARAQLWWGSTTRLRHSFSRRARRFLATFLKSPASAL